MSSVGSDPVARVECPACGSSCIAGETICWQCGASLLPKNSHTDGEIDFASQLGPEHRSVTAQRGERSASAASTGRDFSAEPAPDTAPPGPRTKRVTTLTGEVVEVPITDPDDQSGRESVPDLSYLIRPHTPEQVQPSQEPETPEPEAKQVLRITFCKTCGIQNEETAVECRKCKQPLEIIAEPLPDIQPLPRSWGFDLLGLAWIALGASAAYCGRFVIKADPAHPGVTWSDYFWTGAVVCAPGVLIFMRHWFCRLMFWAMTFASTLIWAVIGFIWLYIGLHVDENGRVGLMWFAALSGLSLISFVTVRLNDEFDAGA